MARRRKPNWDQYREATARFKLNESDWDALLLRTDALGDVGSPKMEAAVADLAGYLPDIDMDALRQMPDGTLGREFTRYMDAEKLDPFQISDDLEEVKKRNTFYVRYFATHDFIHTILDMDASPAGEVGVLAFVVRQGYKSSQWLVLAGMVLGYPIIKPRQFFDYFKNLAFGWRKGREYGFCLNYKFEERWDWPLEKVREELRQMAGKPLPVAA